MIGRRYRERRRAAQILVGRDGLVLARLDQRADAVLELHRPVVGILRMLAPRVGVEIVDHVARAEHQHLLVAQRREPSPELEVLAGGERLVDAELDHGNVRLRVEVHEERPGAVIEAPARVHLHRSGAEEIDHARRELRRAGRRVLHLVEGARETAEVVDRPRPLLGGNARAGYVPVGGDAEDGLRTRQLAGDPLPGPGMLAGLDGVHRIAVAEEECGKTRHRASPP